MNADGWIEEEEFYLWFRMKLPRSYIKRDYMYLSKKICQYLPISTAKTILRCNGKEWNVTLTSIVRRRLVNGWKQFVVDNKLKKGSVLLFELVEATSSAVIFVVEVQG
ncbi:hypothetical protein A4A49_58248 [Nicotiana attenuata]|uniref:TF-B3 domain-containing protein n=1 Tax=Nicotiana attenuata TaxID=49451 RepID=A0A1J6JUI7_NICAT|nr:hypothetical protein A4A49_58248 [Nicotiana attenuata]